MLKAKKSMVLVLVFLLVLGTIGAFNAAAEDESVLLIAKFDSSEAIKKVNDVQRADETNGLATEKNIVLSGNVSAKLVFNTLASSVLFESGDTTYPADLSGYGAFNLWVYSPQVYSSNVHISARSPRTTANNQFNYELPLNFTGWKQVTIPFSAFKAANAPNWSNIEGIRIEKGWTFDQDENVTIYMDRIWLSSRTAATEDTFTIADYSSLAAASRVGLTSDTTITRMYDASAKCEKASGLFVSKTNSYQAARGEVPSDWTSYGYLNVWLYSPQVYDARFNVIVWTGEGTTYRFRYPIELNFTGWKLVSVSLDAMTQYGNTDGDKGPDWKDVSWLQLNGDNKTWNPGADRDIATFNIEKFWLSKEAPIAEEPIGTALVSTNPATGAENVPVDRREVVISYSKPLASPCKGTVTVSGTEDYFVGNYGKEMHVIFYNGLEADRFYEVSAAGPIYTTSGAVINDMAEIFFTAEAAKFNISAPVTVITDNAVTATADARNTFSDAKHATILLAVYNADGKLIDMNFQAYSLPKGSTTMDVSLSGEYNGCTVKAFIWDGLHTMKPLPLTAQQ